MSSKLVTIIISIVVLLILGVGGYFLVPGMFGNSDSSSDENVPTSIDDIDLEQILLNLEDRFPIPLGEEPFVAVVSEKELLDNPFFIDAMNGDLVLAFKEDALIYRISSDEIIKTGKSSDLSSGSEGEFVEVPSADEDNEELPVEEEEIVVEEDLEPLTVEIRNGSGISGLAGKVSKQLDEDDFDVVKTGNAANYDYDTTIIVNQSERSVLGLEEKFAELAVEELPDGEAVSTADVLLILGKDN